MNKVKLSDVCEILNGYAFKSSLYTESGLRIIRITNVQNGYIEDCEPKFYDISKKYEMKNYILKENDLLISLTGNVGRVGILQKEMLPAVLNQRVGCIRIKDETILNKRYLFNMLNNKKFENICINNSKGIAQKNLSTEWLKQYEINLPNIKEQENIAKKLDKIYQIIDIRKKQIEKLDVLIKSKFVEMFQKHKFNNKVCIENVCSEMKIGPFGSALHKNEISSSGDVFVLGTDNAVDNEFKVYEKRYISNKKYQELIKYTVHPDDIIISMMGTIGRTSIIPNDFGRAIISSHLCYLTPKVSVISSDFLHYTLKYNDLIADQIEKQKKGAIMNGLNLKIIKSLEFDLPPIELQNKFTLFVKKIYKQKLELQKSLKEMQRLQESITNKYFGG